jgi:hypothetical protein
VLLATAAVRAEAAADTHAQDTTSATTNPAIQQ